ncbi:MAG: hypothetical protein LCH76_00115 [Actinobacteria bacterium]|nr:hypothetical protein [Actinomycetota bacterium]
MTVRVERAGVAAEIQLAGCMVSPLFDLDGETVRPLYTAPWPDFPDPLLSKLRGDFLCAPFGIAPAAPDRLPTRWQVGEETTESASSHAHGYPANAEWQLSRAGDGQAEFVLELPEAEPIARASRRVICEPGRVVIDDQLIPRRDTRLPLGLHPMVRLPEVEGGAVVLPPGCRSLATYPVPVDASSILAQDVTFDDLRRAPLRAGGSIDLSRLPLALDTEELVQLCDVTTPSVAVENRAEGYRLTIAWDAALRHCLLWISNRGRNFEPWNGRNLCLGVEPVTSAFDLGAVISAGANPMAIDGLATAVELTAGEPYRLSHSFSLASLR